MLQLFFSESKILSEVSEVKSHSCTFLLRGRRSDHPLHREVWPVPSLLPGRWKSESGWGVWEEERSTSNLPSLLYFPTCKEPKISLQLHVSSCAGQAYGCPAPGWGAASPDSDSKVSWANGAAGLSHALQYHFYQLTTKVFKKNIYPRGSHVFYLFFMSF